MAFPRIGPLELVIILVIIMMIFGVGKLPHVGQAMGKAIREFRKSQHEDQLEEETASQPEAIKASQEEPDSVRNKMMH